MRKSLGSKRQQLGEEDIALITRTFGKFEAIEPYRLDKQPDQKSNRGRPASKKKAEKKTFASKIFESFEFGYRRITVERPLRLSVQFTDQRLGELRFASGPLNAAMRALYELYGQQWANDDTGEGYGYGKLAEVEAEVRALIKADFKELKEKQIKELLAPKTWLGQQALLARAVQLQAEIGAEIGAVIGAGQHDDFNAFEERLKKALKATGIKLETKERKQLLDAVTWTNPAAEPVIKKVLKSPGANQPDPMYGAFEYQGQVVQFQPDSNLRDNEDVPLTFDTARGANVNAVNEAYFNKEVAPHVEDAWIDANKCDERDGQIGVVGYEIPFNRHFYQYEPPRDLAEIDADLDLLSAEIMEMLRKVHS